MNTTNPPQQVPWLSVGNAPRVAAFHAVAIYDSKTGRIRHWHHSITLEGAKASDAAAVERRALERAKQVGVLLDQTKTLYLPDFVPSKQSFRVDVKARTLVPLESVKRRSPSPRGRGKKASQ